MSVMTETIGAELAIREVLRELVAYINKPELDANLKELEARAAKIEDPDMKTGYIRALASIQRDRK